MKKIMTICIIAMFTLTAFTAAGLKTENQEKTLPSGDKSDSDHTYNFAIEEVTYDPKCPKEDEYVTFTATVSFEGDTVQMIRVMLYSNGNQVIDNYATPEMPTVQLVYKWPSSLSYTMKIMVDPSDEDYPNGRYLETDETDNTWEKEISPKIKNKTFTNPVLLKILEMFPLLSKLLKF